MQHQASFSGLSCCVVRYDVMFLTGSYTVVLWLATANRLIPFARTRNCGQHVVRCKVLLLSFVLDLVLDLVIGAGCYLILLLLGQTLVAAEGIRLVLVLLAVGCRRVFIACRQRKVAHCFRRLLLALYDRDRTARSLNVNGLI